MLIILRYLTKQLFISMFAVAGILLLIFMSGRFIKYLGDAAAGRLSADVLFAIMGYRLPGFLELILPLGLFIGILLAYGRMYLESEMTVLFACGMSKWRLVKLTMLPAMSVMVVVAAMSFYISPWGMQQVEEIFREQSKITEFEMLVPGRFQSLSSGERVTYTEKLSNDKREMQNVFIAEKDQKEDAIAVLVAKRGTQLVDEKTGSRFVVLHTGARYDGKPGGKEFVKIEYERYGVKIDEPAAASKRRKAEAIPTQQLLNSENPKERALLHWRAAIPLLVPVVTLLAIALSRVNPRQGRFFHLLPAMLIYVSYLGLLIFCRKNLENGKIPEWLGMWWVHAIYLMVAILILFGQDWRQNRRFKHAQA